MNLIQKFISFIRGNPVYSSYRYWGNGNPIWIEDNNEEYIKKGYGGNADVYSIIKRKIDLASSIPWKVQEKQAGKWVDIQDHELQVLIENPNPVMSQSDFIASVLGYYELTGNTYVFAPFLENGLNKGKTKEIWPMAAHNTGIKFGSINNPILGYYYLNQPEELIKPELVCHVKTWNPDSNGYAFYGMSPLRAGCKNLTLGNSAVTANVKSFDNMGPGGIVSRDGEEFTPEQADSLQGRWDRKYTGTENARKIVMTGATIKYHQMGLSPVDLAILDREKYNMGQLCNLWGMPVQMFNNTDKTAFNNMDAAMKLAYLHGVMPGLTAVRDGLNRWLTPRYQSGKNPIWITPDYSAIEVLQANKKEQVEWLAAAFWIKGIEKQRIMGITEDPEMDKYFIPTSLMDSTQEDVEREIQAAEKALQKLKISDYD